MGALTAVGWRPAAGGCMRARCARARLFVRMGAGVRVLLCARRAGEVRACGARVSPRQLGARTVRAFARANACVRAEERLHMCARVFVAGEESGGEGFFWGGGGINRIRAGGGALTG